MNTDNRIVMLEEQAKKGDTKAMNEMGKAYFNGNGVEKDHQKALEWYRGSVWNGDPNAAFDVAHILIAGEKVKKDIDEAFFYVLHAAKAGKAAAQYMVGIYYMHSSFTEKSHVFYNPYTANIWFQKSADQGYASAMFELGNNYWQGKGCIKDQEMAGEFWLEAAKKGEVVSMYNIAWWYENFHYNEANAGYWYNEAAKRGDKNSMEAITKRFQYSQLRKKWIKKY